MEHHEEHVRGMTLRELVLEVRSDVHGIKSELANLKMDHEQVRDHENRLRSLEQKLYIVAGSLAFIGMIGARVLDKTGAF